MRDPTLPPLTARWAPPACLGEGPRWHTSTGFRVTLTPNTSLRELSLDSWNEATGMWHEASLSLRHYPTALIPWKRNEFLLAGTTVLGATVIERLTFSEPRSMRNLDTGEVRFADIAVLSRETLYDEDFAGRKHVQWMAEFPKDSNRILLQFHDSGDICALDLSTKQCSIVASADPAVLEAVLVPELASIRYNSAWSARHRVHGDICVVGDVRYRMNGDSLVLVDGDRNGSVDSHLLLDRDEWTAMGFGGPASYQDR